jgi:hypothetical protein
MSIHDDLQAEQPQKRGMSSTAKVLLVIGLSAAVCMLLCCGLIGFFGYDTFKAIAKMTSKDPAVVKQRTQEVVHIDIPEEYKPVATWGFPVREFSMKQFIYQHATDQNSALVIMEINQPSQPGQDPKQQREAMLQGINQNQQMGNLDMQEESHETRNFTINGEKVPFEFIKGKAHGVAARKVVGVFPGKQGTVMLLLIVTESAYDEEKIVSMIESIRLPGEATATDSGDADEPTEKTPDNAEEMESEAESSSEPATP